jgi:predicted methyltransferase
MVLRVIAVILFLCQPVVGQQRDRRNNNSMRGKGYYREAADYVVRRLGLQSNSIIVDIGAGDGWWAAKIAEKLGPKGVIHAGEVDQEKVGEMKEKWASVPQIKPYLCPTDGTGLSENSCDIAFISKTYHHFAKDTHIDYLRHLKKVVKPSGSLAIIERHADIAIGPDKEHAWQPGLLGHQAEQAGWILFRCEMIPDSDHFMATFVTPGAFAEKLSEHSAVTKSKQFKDDQ